MPPIGGRNTRRSGRVTSSGNMPAVCSNRLRRSCVSVVPKRCAMPGRYQTGSIAILTTDRLPLAWMALPSAFSRPAASASRISIRSSRARVIAMLGRMSRPSAISGLNASGDQMPPRIERDDLLRLAPLRERADRRGRMRVGQVRAGGSDRARPTTPRARDRARRSRRGCRSRCAGRAATPCRSPARARARSRAPHWIGKRTFACRVGMRGEPDMVRAVRRVHRSVPKRPTARHDDGPTDQRFTIWRAPTHTIEDPLKR